MLPLYLCPPCIRSQDMSYPAASLIVSNSLPPNRQGVGASMINAVINLSVSLGLGIAGTTESRVDAHGDGSTSDLLTGQRSAVWCGVGLAGLGVMVTLLFVRVVPVTAHMAVEIEETSKAKQVVVELLETQPMSSAPPSPASASFVPVKEFPISVEQTPAADEHMHEAEGAERLQDESAV